jgi:energy-coupling factor transporter ATP-binding protein EcfA2
MPDGTTKRDTSQAIITPMAISKPNSCTILMEVVIRARKPMDVVRLVKNITLDIKTGILGIVGRTGSGKTTLCHVLARLYPVRDGSVFFDDIVIVNTHKKYPLYKEDPLVIVLDTSDYRKFINKRIGAFNAGILQTESNDWVKGIVFGNHKMMKVKLRLKGDWLDHLIGDKWSFRIKVRGEDTLFGMILFIHLTTASLKKEKDWFFLHLKKEKLN